MRFNVNQNPLLGGNDLATCIESGKGDYGDSSLKTYSNRRSVSGFFLVILF